MRESSQGMFRRSLRLPNIIDSEQAECRYENGVLTVTFPKQERSKARRIEVKASGGQGQIEGEQQQAA
jgi:HSP20 family protein